MGFIRIITQRSHQIRALSFQSHPTKASYNFFRSSKFHFTELWANEKKSIFIFGAQTATMSLVCRRLQLRILASQDTLEGPPPWSVAEWSRSRKATLCFRIFYVAVSVCLCSCLYLSLCCFIYSVDWHDLSTATPFHRVPPQSRRARSIAAPLPQQRLLSRGCSKRRRHRRFEIFILRLFSNCWSSYFYPSGGHYAFSQRSWAQRGIPFNRIEIMHSRLSPRWLLIKIIAGQPKRGSMNFG